MANQLGPNRINEKRAEAHMCRQGIVIRDSTRIRVGKKTLNNGESEMGIRRNMCGKERRI